MSNYRNQFLDALPGNRGATEISLTARADATGMAAAGGIQGLASLHVSTDHAQSRAAWFSQQIQRYQANPPRGVGGDPTQHVASRTMSAQRDGYIAEQPVLRLLDQNYSLALQPTTAASRAIARTRAIQATLGFESQMQDQTGANGAQSGTGFAAALNMGNINNVLREHPELNAANQAVQLKQDGFIGRRQSLHAAAIGYQSVLVTQVMGELRQQAAQATQGVADINARITQVTSLINGVEAGLGAFTGNLANLQTAAGHIDTALNAVSGATERRFAGQDADAPDRSERHARRDEREEAHIQSQHDPDMAERDADGHVVGLGSVEQIDRFRDIARFDQGQRQRQRGVAAEHAVAAAVAAPRVAASNRAAFAEVARAERHGDTPNLTPAPDSAEARLGASMADTSISTARTVAGHTATGLGYLSSAVDAGMRMYYREELATLTARITETTAAISAWNDVQARLALQERQARFIAEKTLFEAAANEYQAALDTRREQYQMIGRLADEAGAPAGQPPSTGNDFNSQAMLYMSAVGETRSMIDVGLEAARAADTQADAATRAMEHRRVAYDTRDTNWSAPLHEATGPDEHVVWDMRQALGGWIREAGAARASLDDEAASARGVMHETY